MQSEHLRDIAAMGVQINDVLKSGTAPPELLHLMTVIATVLRPSRVEQIRGPADIAGLLMVEMAPLDQEELRTALLDSKNHLQAIITVYRGSLNASLVRIGE